MNKVLKLLFLSAFLTLSVTSGANANDDTYGYEATNEVVTMDDEVNTESFDYDTTEENYNTEDSEENYDDEDYMEEE